MYTDFIMNGEGHGEVGQVMSGTRYETGLMRPYHDIVGNGRVTREKYCTINTGRQKFNKETNLFEPIFERVAVKDLIDNGVHSPVFNATSLRKDEWLQVDRVVTRAARQRLRAWSDLAAANPFGGFDGMGKMILERETMSDPGEAIVDMDGITEGRHDHPLFQLEGTPLPITHSDFWFSQRRLTISRNSNTPLNLVMAEAAGRRIAETIEQTLIGTVAGIQYGTAADYNNTPKVYGYTTHPDRVTKTDMTAPTGSNGPTVLGDWLALRDLMYDAKFYGPFMVYTSTDWDRYLDDLFSTSEPSAGTLRSRLKQIDGIQDIKRLDYLTSTFTVIFVQMTPDVAQAVEGMPITTVQWESKGGMQINFKVMAIQVPMLKSDYNGNCGIGHGSTA